MSTFDVDTVLQIGTGIPYNNTISATSGTNTVFNSNKLDIDFEVRGTGTHSTLYYDASTGRLGVGTGLPDAVLHVIAPCSKDGLIVESITNCPTGVTLLLLHNPQTPPLSGSYPATINLAGRDNNYNEINYAQIKSRVLNPTSLATSGEILFLVDHTGVNKEVFVAGLTNLVLGANNKPSGFSYQVFGQNNIGSGNYYLIIGSNNSGSLSTDSIMIGSDNNFRGPQIFAIANDSTLNGSGLYVLGLYNNITGSNSTFCGSNNNSNGSHNLLLANNSTINSNYVIGLIQDGSVSGLSGIILGNSPNINGNNTISIGNNNAVSGNNSNIIGSTIVCSGDKNIVFGNNVFTSGNNLISFGSNQTASGINDGIFIGNDFDLTNSKNVLYVGFNNSTESGLNNSVVVGANNDLDNGNISNIVLLGQYNLTNNIDSSIIIGNTNNASGTLKNNILVGSGNSVVSNSYNNIFLGALNNQTGIYINSQGEVSGTPSFVNTNSTNSIAIGTHNITTLNSSNLLVGHKNIVSGLNLNILGSFNNTRNTNKIYVLGNSNYIDGENIIVLGRNVFGLGQDIIAINNSDSYMDIYGSGSIGIGNNRTICSSVVVGQNNALNGISGLIYGNKNFLGYTTNFFRYNSSSPTQLVLNGEHESKYSMNDDILAQFKNPTGPDQLYKLTLTADPVVDVSNNTTTLTFSPPISNLSTRFYVLNNSFDDNNSPNTTASGIVIPLRKDSVNKYYGSNNIVVGDSNNLLYSNNVVIGYKNNTSGTNSIVIGNNISGVDDNSVHIGSSNLNKLVLNDLGIVFNSGTTQEKIVVRNQAGGTALYHDLINSNLGINNNQPQSALDVSGTVKASSFRMGSSSTSGFVLTTNANGVGSWEFPVNLSGSDNGLLYRVNNKVASGISNITYLSSRSGINFYDTIFVMKTGVVINDDRSSNFPAVPFTVWGSGGAFAPKLMELSPDTNSANFFRIFAESGSVTGLSVTNRINVPSTLTGTFLYVNNSGNLLSRSLNPNNILFSNNDSWSSGNNKLRWFDSSNVFAVSNTGSSINNFSEPDLNIILSSNSSINTSFNNLGLGSNFSVYRSGSAGINNRVGFHILPTGGQVGINTTTANVISENSTLLVNGKISAKNFKYSTTDANAPATGLYLMTAENGDIVPSTLNLNTTFTGIYPLSTDINNSTKLVSVKLNNLKSDGSNHSLSDHGKTLILGPDGWLVGSGLQAYPASSSTNKGVLIGYQASLSSDDGTDNNTGRPSQFNGIAYAGGSFTSADNQRGNSQFAQYFLRGRTSGNSSASLTMNWDTSNNLTTSVTANNTIRLRMDKDLSWTYTVYINCLYQSGSVKGAAGYTVQGTVARYNGVLTQIGNQTIIANTGDGISTPQAITNVSVRPITTSTWDRLDIQVSGGTNGVIYLWSATAMINQLQWPSVAGYSS